LADVDADPLGELAKLLRERFEARRPRGRVPARLLLRDARAGAGPARTRRSAGARSRSLASRRHRVALVSGAHRLVKAGRHERPDSRRDGSPERDPAAAEDGKGTPRMIKSILVGVDGSEHARTALRYALWLAGRLGATVTGLHVVDIVSIEGSFFHDISGSLGFEPYLDFTSKMREALHERGKAILDEFASACREANVRHDTALQIGIVPSEISERAREADLVVIGHRGINQRFSTGLLGGVTESVTRQCRKPVLVTPLEFSEIQAPLLAYDGSERASSAMHVAAEVCAQLALPLAVLTVCREAEQGEKTVDQARRYLSSYAIETT